MTRVDSTLDLSEVLAGTAGTLVAGARQATFSGVCIDSRVLQPGDLFVAFRGERTDGHRFVADALAQGAAGALVEELIDGEGHADSSADPPIVLCRDTGEALQRLAAHYRRGHRVSVVGVTGSVGKTTTKELTARLLEHRFGVLRTPANYNTEIGLPLALLSLQPEHEAAVLEMGMYQRGDIRRLAEIAAPQIGIVTNVHPVHLERLGSMEAIAEAKSELVEALPSDGVALLNADDPRVADMAGRTRASVWRYGIGAGAALRGEDVETHGLDGTTLAISWEGQRSKVHMPAVGKHTVYAALAAAGAGIALGMSLSEATAALADAGPTARLLAVRGLNHSTILDDCYNASPPSALAALDVLAELGGRRVAVLGDMLELGAEEQEAHREIGAYAAAAGVDLLVAVGPLASGYVEGARGVPTTRWAPTVEAGLTALRQLLQPGDCVLVKGSRSMGLEAIGEAVAVVPAQS